MRVKNRDLILLNDIYECLMMHKEALRSHKQPIKGVLNLATNSSAKSIHELQEAIKANTKM